MDAAPDRSCSFVLNILYNKQINYKYNSRLHQANPSYSSIYAYLSIFKLKYNYENEMYPTKIKASK